MSCCKSIEIQHPLLSSPDQAPGPNNHDHHYHHIVTTTTIITNNKALSRANMCMIAKEVLRDHDPEIVNLAGGESVTLRYPSAQAPFALFLLSPPLIRCLLVGQPDRL
jgi:hypothetical protein